MRGSHLTDRMTTDEVGPHTPRLHQPEQRHLNSEQPSLSPHRPPQQIGILAPDDLLERTIQLHIQTRTHRVERIGEHTEPPIQLTAHTHTLRALAREQEGPPRCRRGRAGAFGHGGVGFVRGQGCQAAGEGVEVRGDDGGAVREGGAAGRQCVGDVQGAGRGGLFAEVGEQAVGLGAQGGGGPAGEGPGDRGGLGGGGVVRGVVGLPGLLLGLRLGGLFQDDVGVGAADAEGGDGGAAGPSGLGPVGALGEQFDRSGVPVDVGRRRVDVEGPREDAVAEGHDHFDDAGDARRGLCVADVGLDAAESQRVLPVPAIGGQEGLGLDGVAEGGAGSVCFDGVDLVGGEFGVGECGVDDALLRGAVGGGEPAAGAVLVHRRAADDGEHGVAVAPCVGEPFDEEDADAFAPAGAVGRFGEGLAAAVGGEAALAGEFDEEARRRHDGDAAREGERAFAGAQGPHGEVQGDQ